MIGETCYADDFERSFNEPGEQLTFLKEREQHAYWQRIPTNQVEFQAIDDSITGQVIRQSYIDAGKGGILEDTMQHTQLLLKAQDRVYPVRSCAVTTILSRARISGPALGKVQKNVLARILNACVKVASGQALLRFSDEKVSAMHGGDESEYSVLEAPALFEAVMEELNSNFEECEYSGGHFDHSLISAVWSFPKNLELIDTYTQALQDRGLSVGHFTPAVRFTTSDVGVSGANLYPLLLTRGRSISIGSPLVLEHKHGADLQKFKDQLQLLYPRYLDAVTQLCKLMDIEVEYSYNTLLRVMKRIGVNKKLAYEIAENWKIKNGDGACTAHDLYLEIGEATFLQQRDGASASRIMQMEENVSRALKIKWGDFDYPGDVKW